MSRPASFSRRLPERRLQDPRRCDAWLERRSFRHPLVERRFDATFRRQETRTARSRSAASIPIPRGGICFTAQFRRVIDSGLGGMANNFDTISLHTLPNPRTPEELWPDLSKDEEAKLARASRADRARKSRLCAARRRRMRPARPRRQIGRRAVRRNGAASLVVAEAVRLLHDGPAYHDIKLGLGNPGQAFAAAERKLHGAGHGGTELRRADRNRIAKIERRSR